MIETVQEVLPIIKDMEDPRGEYPAVVEDDGFWSEAWCAANEPSAEETLHTTWGEWGDHHFH